MVPKENVKIGMKIVFLLIEVLLFLLSAIILIFTVIFYYKTRKLLVMPMGSLILIVFSPVIGILNGIQGWYCISSKRRGRLFIFVITLVLLMNFEMLLAIHASKLTDHHPKWISRTWDRMNSLQKSLVEKQMGCTGLNSMDDRPSGQTTEDTPCIEKMSIINIAIKRSIQKLMGVLFLLESISLSILAFLKIGRD